MTDKEKFDITSDELDRLQKALKNEEFRKLFVEYAQEIQDPDNRKKYEEEIAQMERERGMDVEFIHPQPGYVLKTTSGKMKVFVNVCQNDKVGKPSCQRSTAGIGRSGLSWSVPHSMSQPREDKDKSGEKCEVYDVVFHPDTLRMANSNPRFRQMVTDVTFEALKKQFGIVLDTKNVKTPKMDFKGTPQPTILRKKGKDKQGGEEKEEGESKGPDPFGGNYPYGNETSEEKADRLRKEVEHQQKLKEKEDKGKVPPKEEEKYTVPKYNIVHRSDIELEQFTNNRDSRPSTRPKELVVTIDLPLIKKASDVDLDIFERRLVLCSEKPAAYKLDLALPYPVDDEQGGAKFDKSKRKLIVTLPVLKATIPELEADGLGESAAAEDSKPLIEVLPSAEEKSDDVPNGHFTDESPKMEEDREVEQKGASDEPKVETVSDKSGQDGESKPGDGTEMAEEPQSKTEETSSVKYRLPEFDYFQDRKTVTVIAKVSRLRWGSISKLCNAEENTMSTIFTSIGSGGFPMHYQLQLKFPSECEFVFEKSNVEGSKDGPVMTVVKATKCRRHWSSFFVSVDGEEWQEKVLLTGEGGESEGGTTDEEEHSSATAGAASVTAVAKERGDALKISLDDVHDEEASPDKSSPGSGVEVVFSSPRPQLQGILKRTTSESSDDGGLSASWHSGCSAGSGIHHTDDPISEEADEDLDEEGQPRTHRSVSFSKQVDQTFYKSNESVTQLHKTMNAKKKKHRKRDAAAAAAKGRRRRFSSGGSETSSGDEKGHGNGRRHRRQVQKDLEGGKSVVPGDRAEKSGGSESKSEESESGTTEKKPKVEELEPSEANGQASESKGETNNNKSVSESKPDSNGLTVDEVAIDTVTGSIGGSDGKPGPDGDGEGALDTDDDEEGETGGEGRKDGWGNGLEQIDLVKHKTECAVQFANDVMFDLDDD